MELSSVNKVSRKVVKQFPEMKGSKPSIRTRSGPGSKLQYELTYKGKADLPGGRSIRRVVRVVANEKGKVIRMSTSK
jgi:hypothetical protein